MSVPFVTFEIWGMVGSAGIKVLQGPDALTADPVPVPLPTAIGPLATWPPPDPVRGYGERLLQSLNGVANPKIREAFRHAATNNSTIYFKLTSPDWEPQAFEALCENGDFFLLTPSRGIARVVDPSKSRDAPAFRLEEPLRVMAVMSAAGVANAPQWDALFGAVRANARDTHALPARIKLLTGEEELVNTVPKNAAKAGLTVEVVPIDGGKEQTVAREIKRFRPHILHFFCHGQEANGAGVLRLSNIEQHRASIKSQKTEGAEYSFGMGFDVLGSMVDAARDEGWLWLTVLNACKLGAAAAEVSVLSKKLAVAGVPAVIGMTREVDVDDAREFCGSFYASLFLELARARLKLQTEQEYRLDWAKLLHEARMGICGKRGPATCHPQWTFPVLFVGTADFKLQPPRRGGPPPVESAGLAYAIRDGAVEVADAPEDVLAELRNVDIRS